MILNQRVDKWKGKNCPLTRRIKHQRAMGQERNEGWKNEEKI